MIDKGDHTEIHTPTHPHTVLLWSDVIDRTEGENKKGARKL